MLHQPFPADFYKHLQQHTLTGIRAGRKHHAFLDIWMVEVEGRIFARSWGKSQRSWFTTLLTEGTGEIMYGEQQLYIRGIKQEDPEMNRLISKAYLARYQAPESIPYAEGIAREDYFDYTMELVPA